MHHRGRKERGHFARFGDPSARLDAEHCAAALWLSKNPALNCRLRGFNAGIPHTAPSCRLMTLLTQDAILA
jgi:hypothetical protein